MSERFELVFTREFPERLRGFSKQTHIGILRELRILEEKPLVGKRLTERLSGLLSFRVGEYRVLYQLSGNRIIIRTVRHRGEIYEG